MAKQIYLTARSCPVQPEMNQTIRRKNKIATQSAATIDWTWDLISFFSVVVGIRCCELDHPTKCTTRPHLISLSEGKQSSVASFLIDLWLAVKYTPRFLTVFPAAENKSDVSIHLLITCFVFWGVNRFGERAQFASDQLNYAPSLAHKIRTEMNTNMIPIVDVTVMAT